MHSTANTVAPPVVAPMPERRWRRYLRWCLRAMALFIASSILLVLLFRFVPVPVSGVMIERKLQNFGLATHYQWMPVDHIAPALQLAMIAGEDQRFPQHHGFDLQQMEKAIDAHKRGKRLRGASTLSQQVAKNLFLWSGRSFIRKGLEAWFTLLIETCWSKQRILEVHLNIVEFGDGIYGAQAASRQFFHRDAAKLSWSQAALLAAVLPNPHRFHADKPSVYVNARQQWIIGQMNSLGGLTYLNELK